MGAACVFCEIVAARIHAPVVYEDTDIVGFLDHRPLFKGHTLLLPREHVVTLSDLPERLLVPLFGAAQRTADAITGALDAQGTFVAMNNIVSQSVAHLHVHVVPRTKGDGLRGFFWPRTRYAEGEDEEYAARLREALGSPA